MKTSILFAGQGSQYVGMVKDLYEIYPQTKQAVVKADEIAGFKLSDILFEGPPERLKETRYTQPAIFLHSAILFDLLKVNISYDAVAGHSVGEYAALYAAGCLSFEDAFKLVLIRGSLMFDAGKEEPGTMFAVIGLDDEKVVQVCNKLNDDENRNIVVAANFNSPGQIVISGSAEYIRENKDEFKNAGAKLVKELAVSGAFHSPLMQPAKEKLEDTINKIKFSDAKVPVYTNVYAEPVTKAEEIKKALILQLTSPVKWTQTLKNMGSEGIKKYIELGPGKVLQGLTKRTLSDVEILGADKVEDFDKFL